MTQATVHDAARPPASWTGLSLVEVACSPAGDALTQLSTTPGGLSAQESVSRLARIGPNAVRDHRARAWGVLVRQLRSPLLVLLAGTAVVSFFLGETTSAAIIAVILASSIGLGFVNEYRAERAAQALHTRIRHTVVALREGQPEEVDVTDLVPGDIVRLQMGAIVPADLRLLDAVDLQCDESMLTGESVPVDKNTEPMDGPRTVTDLPNCALMGTIVRAGTGTGVVVATGGQAEFGRIALALGTRQPETDFQAGLRRFSMLLMRVAAVLTTLILATNLLLHRPVIDAVLFSLAIAVGITPQLLPAVVSTSLAAGSRRLAAVKVLVKRLVCIEDLGDLDILVTDKTGTLTEGRITFAAALDETGQVSERALLLGLLASDVDLRDGVPVGGNALDVALYQAPGAASQPLASYRRITDVPFDHDRQMSSVVVDSPDGTRLLVTKGAPEAVLARCDLPPSDVHETLRRQFSAGARVVAVATRPAPELSDPTAADEHGLQLVGILTFRDQPKVDSAASLQRLAGLGVTVKVATGDNPLVAEKVCADLGLTSGGTLIGADIDGMDDTQLAAAAETATIFARVSPEQKARLIRLLRHPGRAVGFLGDGVNDTLAIHAADVGISVDTGSDVAKDAADVVLLEKDLGVLADGISEGRRIFANTIKYVLMGTSSNFGNMFSAAGASALLSFLPMLPSQILLNNLLYDASQLTIPTDHVDEEQLRRPSHWDIGFIRRFMLFFGLISSLFDFVLFGVMLGVFHAGPELFRTGWFVESLATQTLVIFAVRTRRVPFLRSRPSWPLATAALGIVALGIGLTLTPLAGPLGFVSLPIGFFLVLVGMLLAYLLLIEAGKLMFYATPEPSAPRRVRGTAHRIHRRASRFSSATTT
ncbi:MAG: magnesium-translocating P-type ATPase [Mycobacteriaceae bacterium]